MLLPIHVVPFGDDLAVLVVFAEQAMTNPAGRVRWRVALVVSPRSVPRVIPADPDDDHVLAAALAGAANLIASGDKRDLLPLGSYQGIPIVTAREVVERLEAQSKA